MEAACVSNRRFLKAKAMSSVVLYAAPIWLQALDIKSYARLINPVLQLSGIRVVSAFPNI